MYIIWRPVEYWIFPHMKFFHILYALFAQRSQPVIYIICWKAQGLQINFGNLLYVLVSVNTLVKIHYSGNS